jgi:hypothetical protein
LSCGTVFSLTPPAPPGGSWTETILYNLTQSDGFGQLDAAIVIGSGGVLHGATETGGPAGAGRVFSLTPPATPVRSWTETVLYDFTGPSDGVYPVGLAIGDGGMLYGSANRGGPFGNGTVFSLTPPASPGSSWTETTLYSFTGASGDGGYPYAGVTIGSSGVLYGTTDDGFGGKGNIFSLTPPTSQGGSWTEVLLYEFTDGSDGGYNPFVVIGSGPSGHPVLYGTTSEGGIWGKGTVFSLTL